MTLKKEAALIINNLIQESNQTFVDSRLAKDIYSSNALQL